MLGSCVWLSHWLLVGFRRLFGLAVMVDRWLWFEVVFCGLLVLSLLLLVVRCCFGASFWLVEGTTVIASMSSSSAGRLFCCGCGRVVWWVVWFIVMCDVWLFVFWVITVWLCLFCCSAMMLGSLSVVL